MSLMKVNVKLLSGSAETIEVEVGASIADLKDKIHEVLGHHPAAQSLVKQRKVLSPDATLEQLGIEDGSNDVLCLLKADIADVLAALEGLDLPKYDGSNLAEAAAKGAWYDVIRLVEENTDLDAKFDCGYTAIMHLAAVPHAYNDNFDPVPASKLMHWLILRGADMNARDDNAKTALHVWGKFGGSLEQGRVLLDNGADFNARACSEARTPLFSVRDYQSPRPPASQADAWSAEPMWKAADRMLVEVGAESHCGTAGDGPGYC